MSDKAARVQRRIEDRKKLAIKKSLERERGRAKVAEAQAQKAKTKAAKKKANKANLT